jgi:molybdopterin/thiamine biosynthesis adenylyltransferase
VGRPKVRAVRDRILDINPSATVDALPETIQLTRKEKFDQFFTNGETIIIGCADNREADLYANRIACLYKAPFVSIGLWERAFAGEVFWTLAGERPCYFCLFGSQAGQNVSSRKSVNQRFYTTEEHLRNVTFEPGTSVDIGFVTQVGIKIALDLLNRRSGKGPPRVLDSVTQFTLICNTTSSVTGGGLVDLFTYPLQITRSISVQQLNDCPHCRLAGRGR